MCACVHVCVARLFACPFRLSSHPIGVARRSVGSAGAQHRRGCAVTRPKARKRCRRVEGQTAKQDKTRQARKDPCLDSDAVLPLLELTANEQSMRVVPSPRLRLRSCLLLLLFVVRCRVRLAPCVTASTQPNRVDHNKRERQGTKRTARPERPTVSISLSLSLSHTHNTQPTTTA